MQLGDAVFESHNQNYLKEVKAHADSIKKIGKEFDLVKNIEISSMIGADIAKDGLDLVRPKPVMGSRFIPEV